MSCASHWRDTKMSKTKSPLGINNYIDTLGILLVPAIVFHFSSKKAAQGSFDESSKRLGLRKQDSPAQPARCRALPPTCSAFLLLYWF